MIVDQAEDDCEVVQDPFLEAGIAIPSDLPYQDKVNEKEEQKDDIKIKKASKTIVVENDANIPLPTINVSNRN